METDNKLQSNGLQPQKILSNKLTLLFFAILTLLITIVFIEKTLLVVTLVFYLFIAYTLVVSWKTGIILLALNFALLPSSFTAITGNFHSFFFYGAFISGLIFVLYAGILGYRVEIPSLMMDKYMLLFALYLVFSLVVVTGERAYGLEKTKYFLMNVILFYLPILLVKKKEDLEECLRAILYFALFFTVFALLSYFDLEQYYGRSIAGRFSSLGQNPIWMARYFSYAILIEMYYLVKLSPRFAANLGKIILLIVLMSIQLYLAMMTASRGPILAMIIALVVVLFIVAKFRISYLLYSAAIVGLVILTAVNIVPEDVIARLLTREAGGQTTTLLRIVSNLDALEMFMSNKVFGAGIGAFNIYYLKYPHNILTEVLAELGITGFVLISLILGLSVVYLYKLRNSLDKKQYYFLIALIVSAFINANLSGHIGSNFYLFLSFGLIYSVVDIKNFNP